MMLAVAHAAAAAEPMALTAPTLTFQPAPSEAAAEVATSPPPAAFGTKGQEWWTIGGGIANDFSDATDYNLRLAWSRFLADRVEFSVEANAWAFTQRGDDAVGINPAFLFRYHFYRVDRLTLFADIGIGLLFSTSDVPEGGTSFNFTPRAGVGLTYQLTDTAPTRLQLGVRWHHVSNAHITGDTNNPSRDALMLSAGVLFPF